MFVQIVLRRRTARRLETRPPWRRVLCGGGAAFGGDGGLFDGTGLARGSTDWVPARGGAAGELALEGAVC